MTRFYRLAAPFAAMLLGAAIPLHASALDGITTVSTAQVVNAAQTGNGSEVIARRGNAQLTVADVRDLIERADPQLRAQIVANPSVLANVVRERLLQIGLAAEAREKGWDKRPDVALRMNEAREAVLAQFYLAEQTQPEIGYPTKADISAAYEANKARFVLPKQYHLAQIVILIPPGSTPQVEEELKRKMQDLRAQALKPKADFAEVARANSQQKNAADKGGDLGFLREDQLVPGIKDAVMQLADGTISDVIRGPAGWHVLKLIGSKPATPASLADVQDQLVLALRQARQQQAVRGYLDTMMQREPAQLNEIELNRALATRQ